MPTVATSLESIRQRLAPSELLARLRLEACAAGERIRADATLSPAGHDLVARSGADAAFEALARVAGADASRLDWRFSSGRPDPWPAGMPRGARLAPAIWSWLSQGDRHRFLIDVGGDLAWIDGHFPQTPILAGVVQLHWAALLAQGVFGLAAFPRDIVRLKFQRPVLPPALLELDLQRIDELNVQFHFRSPGNAHSQGRLLFGGDAP